MSNRARFANSFLLLIVLSFIVQVLTAGCAYDPYKVNEGIPTDEWCDQDSNMPWTGCWEEISQIDCESGEEFESGDTVGEFRLRADNIYSVTRHPFEHWVDYSGSYTVIETDGTITFSPIDTPGFDGEGSYSIRENGDLVLNDIWFGIYSDSAESDSDPSGVSCGYVFRSD